MGSPGDTEDSVYGASRRGGRAVAGSGRARVAEAHAAAGARSADGPPASFWQVFGPGLLWAAAAIGVSHLVQSTRAGADAGFALAWVVIAAVCLKYPFFEFGPRYAAATGESLVEGYARQGRWAL
jgi:Mn2+/Fe2+ NRAMP family transporter